MTGDKALHRLCKELLLEVVLTVRPKPITNQYTDKPSLFCKAFTCKKEYKPYTLFFL